MEKDIMQMNRTSAINNPAALNVVATERNNENDASPSIERGESASHRTSSPYSTLLARRNILLIEGSVLSTVGTFFQVVPQLFEKCTDHLNSLTATYSDGRFTGTYNCGEFSGEYDNGTLNGVYQDARSPFVADLTVGTRYIGTTLLFLSAIQFLRVVITTIRCRLP